MPSDTRPESAAAYHHGDLRNALIRAGLAILAEEGVQALSLRAVARHAGVSHAAPYRHFADKEALLAAIAEQGFDMLAAAVRMAADRFPSDPMAQLTEAGWAYVQFALHHPGHLRVMFGGMISTPADHPALKAAGGAAFSLLVGITQAGQRAGVIVEGAPQLLALASWALVHGLAVLSIDQQITSDMGGSAGAEQLTRLCGELLHDGLRPRAAASEDR